MEYRPKQEKYSTVRILRCCRYQPAYVPLPSREGFMNHRWFCFVTVPRLSTHLSPLIRFGVLSDKIPQIPPFHVCPLSARGTPDAKTRRRRRDDRLETSKQPKALLFPIRMLAVSSQLKHASCDTRSTSRLGLWLPRPGRMRGSLICRPSIFSGNVHIPEGQSAHVKGPGLLARGPEPRMKCTLLLNYFSLSLASLVQTVVS
jgi:hypothetical protein